MYKRQSHGIEEPEAWADGAADIIMMVTSAVELASRSYAPRSTEDLGGLAGTGGTVVIGAEAGDFIKVLLWGAELRE